MNLKVRLLYPALFLGVIPLYALLTFGFNVHFAYSVIIIVAILTIIPTVMEMYEGRFFNNRRGTPRGALDAYYIVMGVIISTLEIAVYVALGSWIRTELGFTAPLYSGSIWIECIAAILFMDFCAYWIHRIQHMSENNILWRSHSVHHALQFLDVVGGAQVHILDGIISSSPLLLMAILGFSPEACGAAFVINLVAAGIHHTALDTDLRWFNYVTIAPQTHKWHHADATPKTVNYGFVFAIWDILFGTFSFPPSSTPVRYGAKSVETFPPSVIGHILVGTTDRAYRQLVKVNPAR